MADGHGLRETKRRAAMARIQLAALDLFDAEGYGAVSVEAVAHAAGVAPRTVYRYFATKAGILLTQPEDDDVLAALAVRVREVDVLDAVRELLPTFTDLSFTTPDGYWSRVLRYVLVEPELVGEVRALVLAAADRLAAAQAQARGLAQDDLTTRVRARLVLTALLTALEVATTSDDDLADLAARALDEVGPAHPGR